MYVGFRSRFISFDWCIFGFREAGVARSVGLCGALQGASTLTVAVQRYSPSSCDDRPVSRGQNMHMHGICKRIFCFKIRLMHILRVSSAELKKLMGELSELCRVHGRQKEIAREMGVSEQVLSNWLNGSRSPSLESFFKIRDFLEKQK